MTKLEGRNKTIGWLIARPPRIQRDGFSVFGGEGCRLLRRTNAELAGGLPFCKVAQAQSCLTTECIVPECAVTRADLFNQQRQTPQSQTSGKSARFHLSDKRCELNRSMQHHLAS